MSELDRALNDISTIRRQVAESTQFRGYGPVTLAGTGILAIAAAIMQWQWFPHPERQITAYVWIWIVTAMLSAALIGTEMFARTRRIHFGLADEMLRMAVEQFLPSLVAGALITITLVRFVPGSIWMLPGLWQVISALGILSSCRFLPQPMIVVGTWYLLTGLVSLSLADARALSPLGMGFSYAVGQFLMAGILLLSQKGGKA